MKTNHLISQMFVSFGRSYAFKWLCFLGLFGTVCLPTTKVNAEQWSYNAKHDIALISGLIGRFKDDIKELKVYCAEDEAYKKANEEKKKALRFAKFKALHIATVKKIISSLWWYVLIESLITIFGLCTFFAVVTIFSLFVNLGGGAWKAYEIYNALNTREKQLEKLKKRISRENVTKVINMEKGISSKISRIQFPEFKDIINDQVTVNTKLKHKIGKLRNKWQTAVQSIALGASSTSALLAMLFPIYLGPLLSSLLVYTRIYLQPNALKSPFKESEEAYITYLPYLHPNNEQEILSRICDGYYAMEAGIFSGLENSRCNILRIIHGNIPMHNGGQNFAEKGDILQPEEVKTLFQYYRKANDLQSALVPLLMTIETQQKLARKRIANKTHNPTQFLGGKRTIALFSGSPGTGKTYFIKNTLASCGVRYQKGQLSNGSLFKQIEMLNQQGGGPTVFLLDDADRYFNNKNISETDLTLLDPNQFYMENPELNSLVRLPDITIIIVNDLKQVAAIQDRVSIWIQSYGFTPEGKLKHCEVRLDEEIEKAKEAGYAFAQDDEQVKTFKAEALRKIKAHIDPAEESIRQDLAFVTNLVNLKKAERLIKKDTSAQKNRYMYY